MERQCLQVNMARTFSVPLSVLYNQLRLQVRTTRVSAKVSDIDNVAFGYSISLDKTWAKRGTIIGRA